jgi:hypothetical protein
MPTQKILNDLHVMIARIDERLLNITEKLEDAKEWQEEHEERDEERFSNLNAYAASVALVSGFIGACGSYLWKKIGGV